jgi:hypothetical protein
LNITNLNDDNKLRELYREREFSPSNAMDKRDSINVVVDE